MICKFVVREKRPLHYGYVRRELDLSTFKDWEIFGEKLRNATHFIITEVGKVEYIDDKLKIREILLEEVSE